MKRSVIMWRLDSGMKERVLEAARGRGVGMSAWLSWVVSRELGGITSDGGDMGTRKFYDTHPTTRICSAMDMPTQREEREYGGPVEVKADDSLRLDEGSFEDWLREYGLMEVINDRREDHELEFNELNGMARANLRGEVMKLRAKEGVKRRDVERLAAKFHIGV